MFGELAHGSDTNDIGKYILDQIKMYLDKKADIRQLLLPLYEKFVTWDEGNCRDFDIEKQIRESLR